MLGMPLSKQLGGGLRELRFTCEGVARRITYVLEPERKAITLTTFRKQRQNERGEILRARRAQALSARSGSDQGRPKEEEVIMRTTPFRQAEAEALAAMTPDERARFDAAGAEEEARLRLAELVYAARTRAGLSQTELAGRMGTQQSVISAVENGGQVPSVSTLWRIARALDLRLTIDMAAAS